MPEDNEITRIESCIALLEQHNKIHLLSIVATIFALLMLLLKSVLVEISFAGLFVLLLVVIMGLVEVVFAVRVGFDSQLLKNLCKNNAHTREIASAKLGVLDDSLVQLALIKSNKTARALNERLLACIRLFKQQAFFCFFQYILLAGLMTSRFCSFV
ncbi:hypothetical protein MNBD_GAMMA10-1313 [hydrothermal vent metagenome]|uniref:Uncharacterized protein n=2 Tax=hydrothermal vent metagenome TaxID=652676 RepID=A0A3B0XG56_9ZZZZ